MQRSLITHLRCDGDPQGVGIRNKLSYIGLRHFVARPMPTERASLRMRLRCRWTSLKRVSPGNLTLKGDLLVEYADFPGMPL